MKNLRVRVAGFLKRGGKFLAAEHTKNGVSTLLLPGGGADGGADSIKEDLAREFQEELGMHVEVGGLISVAQSIHPEGKRNILHLIFEVFSEDEPRITGEDARVTGYRFVDKPQELEFRPDILSHLLELLSLDSYNTLNVECPNWLEERTNP